VGAVRGFGRSFDSILVGPARAHTPQVQVFNQNLALANGFTVLDQNTKLADANFSNGLDVS
jgi:hypothetical protein